MNIRKLIPLLAALLVLLPKIAHPQDASEKKITEGTNSIQRGPSTSPLPEQTASAKTASDASEENRLLISLASSDRRDLVNAAIQFRLRRADLIHKLLAMVDSTNSVNQKFGAIIVLGQYRAAEAVPVLVRHLEWDKQTLGPIRLYSPSSLERVADESGPVGIALEEIGSPAVPALLGRITEVDDANIIGKCTFICSRIEGANATQFRLQSSLTKEADLKKKSRIQSALEILEKIKRNEYVP